MEGPLRDDNAQPLQRAARLLSQRSTEEAELRCALFDCIGALHCYRGTSARWAVMFFDAIASPLRASALERLVQANRGDVLGGTLTYFEKRSVQASPVSQSSVLRVVVACVLTGHPQYSVRTDQSFSSLQALRICRLTMRALHGQQTQQKADDCLLVLSRLCAHFVACSEMICCQADFRGLVKALQGAMDHLNGSSAQLQTLAILLRSLGRQLLHFATFASAHEDTNKLVVRFCTWLASSTTSRRSANEMSLSLAAVLTIAPWLNTAALDEIEPLLSAGMLHSTTVGLVFRIVAACPVRATIRPDSAAFAESVRKQVRLHFMALLQKHESTLTELNLCPAVCDLMRTVLNDESECRSLVHECASDTQALLEVGRVTLQRLRDNATAPSLRIASASKLSVVFRLTGVCALETRPPLLAASREVFMVRSIPAVAGKFMLSCPCCRLRYHGAHQCPHKLLFCWSCSRRSMPSYCAVLPEIHA